MTVKTIMTSARVKPLKYAHFLTIRTPRAKTTRLLWVFRKTHLRFAVVRLLNYPTSPSYGSRAAPSSSLAALALHTRLTLLILIYIYITSPNQKLIQKAYFLYLSHLSSNALTSAIASSWVYLYFDKLIKILPCDSSKSFCLILYG